MPPTRTRKSHWPQGLGKASCPGPPPGLCASRVLYEPVDVRQRPSRPLCDDDSVEARGRPGLASAPSPVRLASEQDGGSVRSARPCCTLKMSCPSAEGRGTNLRW